MSASNGRHYLAIPGPSAIPDEVLRAMHRPGPNIYGQPQGDLQAGLLADLKKVARTTQHAAMYIANGHGTWEAALANVLACGDRVLVLATGRFAHGWATMARQLGIETEVIDFGLRSPVDLQRVSDALAADVNHRYKAVLAVHVDTATSVRNDIRGLRDVIDSANHPGLLMVDCIASLGCDPFETDALGVDVMVAACQKGLMTPPGLGFVFFSERAAQVRAQMRLVSSYWDWTKRCSPDEFYEYFCGTPPTHLLYGLRVALDIILEEGMEAVWERHELLARGIHAAVEAWGAKGPMELNITNPEHRSCAVTAVRIGAPQGTQLRDWLSEQAGVTLGIGLGMADRSDPEWHGFFRIGHMGHVNRQMVMGVLGSIDTGLKTLGIEHGNGALDAASVALAGKHSV
ncbi:septum site-determining protein [Chromatiales bacterium (ex Bugula neritina AB1)]|nr:septum site-determining protein [Chromatiales bacterium (ex Bugula neritina AB1)]